MPVDNEPFVPEGNRGYTRTVLIRFESKKDSWAGIIAGYKEILAHRLNSANCDTVL